MTQFTAGSGNYATDRDGMFAGRTVAELAADIRVSVAAEPAGGGN